MSHHHKHDRDDKRSRWEDQSWQEQRDADDNQTPEPEEDDPVHTLQ